MSLGNQMFRGSMYHSHPLYEEDLDPIISAKPFGSKGPPLPRKEFYT